MKLIGRLYRGFKTFAVALVIAQFLVLFSLDKVLMIDEPLIASDYAVVLDGDNTRLLRAKELFDQGLVASILVSDGEPPRPNEIDRITEQLGYRLPDRTQIKVDILVALGVPKDRIGIFGKSSLNSRDEARGFAEFLKGEKARVILVTNAYHSRRAKNVFEAYAPNAEYRVACLGGCVAPDEWRTSPSLVASYVLEFIKTVYFRLGFASV